MEKEFVPYELAVKLKELGFSNPYSIGGYQGGAVFYYEEGKLYYDGRPMYSSDSHAGQIDAPLFQQAFRWFREKHNMPCKIEASQEDLKVNAYHYFYQIQTGSHIVGFGIQHNLTYEEAELACLTKLIEIVETRTK